ncbi:MAG: 4Fe-4S binding protein [Clostridiales bacterium]|nr:4Fe-4S binding protein [Clostridiales bacterium]
MTTRQKIRRTALFISFLLFPITMWYFSPYLIIMAASQHVINGSFIVFCAMLLFSIFFGRAWCGYLCPAGGLQECAMRIKDTPAKQGWRNNIKYVIWVLWIAGVFTAFVLGKNGVTVNPFYMTDHGISIAEIGAYIIYYGVMLLLVLPALLHGRRAACHYICWMAPFMVIGGTLGRILHLPQLHIASDKTNCVSCKKCSQACPMGLDVLKMVQAGKTGTCTECINCGACVDGCPKGAVKYAFLWRREKH